MDESCRLIIVKPTTMNNFLHRRKDFPPLNKCTFLQVIISQSLVNMCWGFSWSYHQVAPYCDCCNCSDCCLYKQNLSDSKIKQLFNHNSTEATINQINSKQSQSPNQQQRVNSRNSNHTIISPRNSLPLNQILFDQFDFQKEGNNSRQLSKTNTIPSTIPTLNQSFPPLKVYRQPVNQPQFQPYAPPTYQPRFQPNPPAYLPSFQPNPLAYQPRFQPYTPPAYQNNVHSFAISRVLSSSNIAGKRFEPYNPIKNYKPQSLVRLSLDDYNWIKGAEKNDGSYIQMNESGRENPSEIRSNSTLSARIISENISGRTIQQLNEDRCKRQQRMNQINIKIKQPLYLINGLLYGYQGNGNWIKVSSQRNGAPAMYQPRNPGQLDFRR